MRSLLAARQLSAVTLVPFVIGCVPDDSTYVELHPHPIEVEPGELPASYELTIVAEGEDALIESSMLSIEGVVIEGFDASVRVVATAPDGRDASAVIDSMDGALLEIEVADEGPFEQRWVVTFDEAGEMAQAVTIGWFATVTLTWKSRDDGFALEMQARPLLQP